MPDNQSRDPQCDIAPPPQPGRFDARQAAVAWGASSVVGLRRKSNQDRYFQQGSTFGVADGMGGVAGGAEASECAVEFALHSFSTLVPGAPLTRWNALVRSVNRETRDKLLEMGFQSAGCTLTVATVEPTRVVVAHVGDSRLYDYEPLTGLLRQRTVDHNLRNELATQDKSLREAAENGLPLAGLVSYIGMPDEDLKVDVFGWSPEPGARLLLCSDGVHGSLEEESLAEVLSTFPASGAATELTQRADAAGGRDNSTAVVVELS